MNSFTPAGQMKKLLTIESISTTRTTAGETTDTATEVCQTWAKIEPISGREYYAAKAQQETTTHRINMPYRSDITARMRATWNGRTFNFTTVINVREADRELEIMATEVMA